MLHCVFYYHKTHLYLKMYSTFSPLSLYICLSSFIPQSSSLHTSFVLFTSHLYWPLTHPSNRHTDLTLLLVIFLSSCHLHDVVYMFVCLDRVYVLMVGALGWRRCSCVDVHTCTYIFSYSFLLTSPIIPSTSYIPSCFIISEAKIYSPK